MPLSRCLLALGLASLTACSSRDAGRSATVAGDTGGAAASGSTAAAESLDVFSWWPSRDSLFLVLPGADGVATVRTWTAGPHPCRGAVFIAIQTAAGVVYADTVRMDPGDVCKAAHVADLARTLQSLRALTPATTWEALQTATTAEERAQYGMHPYLLTYVNGYESSRAIVWNAVDHRFDVLIPSGAW